MQRADLRRTRVSPDPEGPGTRFLREGEARLSLEHFALTANNITYAAFGESMRYWSFFPSEDSGWGCIPVWGFTTVSESKVAGLDVGRRIYGFLPMGSHLVVQPGTMSRRGFTDIQHHRNDLPAVYNQYAFSDAEFGFQRENEAHHALLRPLFITAFLIDDFLAEQQWFGAQRIVLSSASSKTASATAFCLSLRRGTPGMPRIAGMTSGRHLSFVRALGCFDEALPYDGLSALNDALPTVYVDFSGSATTRRAVHEFLGAALRYSCAVGGTHWEDIGSAAGLPGPRPELFFAPSRVKQRQAPPPAGWGRDGLQQRVDATWQHFIARVSDPARPWLTVHHGRGVAAVERAYRELLDGSAPADVGMMLRL